MNHMYMTPGADYSASPLSFGAVPDLVPCAFDDVSTDPSPSPPVMFASLDSQFHSYPTNSTTSSYHEYPQTQPTIINSIEFTDLTQIQHEDRRRRRSNNTLQDKEAASNMRIRRRAQNRASQRAFRERKEKHVQHLEHELEELESKHQKLNQSYSDLDSTHSKLKGEVDVLRAELTKLKEGRESSSTMAEAEVKRERERWWDPFANGSEGAFFGGEEGFN